MYNFNSFFAFSDTSVDDDATSLLAFSWCGSASGLTCVYLGCSKSADVSCFGSIAEDLPFDAIEASTAEASAEDAIADGLLFSSDLSCKILTARSLSGLYVSSISWEIKLTFSSRFFSSFFPFLFVTFNSS